MQSLKKSQDSDEFTGLKLDAKSVGGMGDLQEKLREHNAFIDMMLSMIPTRMYLPHEIRSLGRTHLAHQHELEDDDDDDDFSEQPASSRLWKKPSAKDTEHMERKLRRLHANLDPEIQDSQSIPLLLRTKAELTQQKEATRKGAEHSSNIQLSKDMLRERLKERIESFRASRRTAEGQAEEGGEKGERKQRKQAEKERTRKRRSRDEDAQPEGAPQKAGPSAEQPAAKKQPKKQPAAKKQRGRDGDLMSRMAEEKNASAQKAAHARVPQHGDRAQQEQGEKGQVQFGVIDFSTGTPLPSYLAHRRKPTNEYLLKKAEAKQASMQEAIQSADKQHVVSNELWKKALARAQGEKIKDDPALLRKTIRKAKNKRVKSAKQWSERNEAQQLEQDKRQQKRDSNIQKRLQYKKERRESQRKGISKKQFDKMREKNKKKEIAEKIGNRRRAGFEGKKIAKSPAK